MSLENLIALIGLGLIILTNIVVITAFMTKQSSKILKCESDLEVLFNIYKEHSAELKTLSKIQSQLEVLTKHIIPTS